MEDSWTSAADEESRSTMAPGVQPETVARFVTGQNEPRGRTRASRRRFRLRRIHQRVALADESGGVGGAATAAGRERFDRASRPASCDLSVR